MEAKDQTFEKVEQVLDGNVFESCQFNNCVLVYRGGPLPTINHCTMTDCRWQFEEAAERTVMLMKMLYHGLGASGPELIESTIDAIRAPFA